MNASRISTLVFSALLAAACGKKAPVPEEPPVSFTQSLDLFGQPVATAPAPTSPTQTVALVDGHAITLQEVEKEASAIATRLLATQPPERVDQQRDAIVNQAVQDLINRFLLTQAADGAGIAADPSRVEEELGAIRQGLPPDTDLGDFLARQGASEALLRDQIALQLRLNALLLQQVQNLPPPSENELKAFFEQNKAQMVVPAQFQIRHLTIPKSGDAAEDQVAARRRKAHVLGNRVRQGESLSAVLEAESGATDGDIQGGVLTIVQGRTPEELIQAAAKLEKGQVSPPVETKMGFHLIELLDKAESRVLSYEEAHDQLERFMAQQKQQQAIAEYLQALRSKANISFPTAQTAPAAP